MKFVIFTQLFSLQVSFLLGHPMHHAMIYKKDAVSFLRNRRATSSSLCYTDEIYCETNLQQCQNENEDVRELYCSNDPTFCSAGQTCYLSTPCPLHYTLGCSTNPCVSLPCTNNGTCIQQNSTDYFCICSAGYSGTYCEIVDPCLNATCHNGGTCVKNDTMYYCECSQGWDPELDCKTEIYVDPCDDVNTGELQNLESRTSSTPNIGLCDKNLVENWYKAYGYEMITHDPGSNSCGSEKQIYLTATLPNDSDIHNLTACVRDQIGACNTNLSVPVKKCNADTIFYLSPTSSCDSSYCFDQVDLSGQATSWKPSSMYISFNMTWKSTQLGHIPGIVYKCNFNFSSGNLFYKIKWYIDDIKVAESIYVRKESMGKTENTSLIEKYIQTYGVTIKCSVTAAYSPVSPPGIETKSPGFYAGMKLLTPTVSLERGKSGKIIMEPTIPFGCIQYTPNFVCKTRILMTNPYARNKCEQSQVTQSDRCGFEMDGAFMSNTKWFANEQWRKNYTFNVKHREPDQGFVLKKTSYILELKFENPSVALHSTWASTFVDNVVVDVYKSETWMNKRCYVVIDPHMRTFDGRFYEMQMEGTFVLYKHRDRNASVIIRTTSCWRPNITCVCGIVVQAGKDLFVINTCPGSIPMMRFYRCNDGLLRVYSQGEHLYKIYLPTGTRIEAHLRNYNTRYWDVYIYPTNIDVRKTNGLCGTLDGYCYDDFEMRDGSYSTTAGASNPCSVSNGWNWHPNDFSNSWRVTDAEDLFPGPNFAAAYNALYSWPSSLQLCYCPYNRLENHTNTGGLVNEAQCSYREYADCEYDPGREKVCRHHQSRSLRFRKSDSIFENYMFTTSINRNTLQKRSTTMSTIDATTACNVAFNKSITYRMCLDLDLIDESVLETCVQDLKATGDITIAYSHLERGKSECTNSLSQNDTLREEYSDAVAVIEANNCPNECSNHGTCVAGNCTCDNGFAAKDCSMNLTAGIKIYGTSENGICDTAYGICAELEVYGEPFLEDIPPISRFTPFIQAVENETKLLFSPVQTKGEQQSVFSAVFDYPSTSSWSKPPPSNSSFVYGYSLAVSLDGSIFSEESTIYLYDSLCQIYQNTSGGVMFSLKNGNCFINGVCLSNGTVNPSQTCQHCNVAKKKFEWSYLPKCVILSGSSDDKRIKVWVVAVITVVLLGIVFGVTIVIVKKYAVKRKDKNAIEDFKGVRDRQDRVFKQNFNTSKIFLTAGVEKHNLWFKPTSSDGDTSRPTKEKKHKYLMTLTM